MKALRILTFTLLLCVFIVGIQSQAPKPHQHVFKLQLNSVLNDMRDRLSDQEDELDKIKGSVGRSSTKSAKLLSNLVNIIYYLEELLGVSADATTCPVPGAKLSPTRGLCYLLVMVPTLKWNDAHEYCHTLGGYLIQPLPLDTTLGIDLLALFPGLTFGDIWVDGEIVGSTYVFHNGFVYPSINSFVGKHLIMALPPTPIPTISKGFDYVKRPFICQFNATTVFPPYKRAYDYDEYATNIPHRKYMVDVESVNEVYHHSGENDYDHPFGGYSGEMYPGEGGNPGEMYPGGGNPGEMYPGGGNPGGEYPSGTPRKQNPKIIS